MDKHCRTSIPLKLILLLLGLKRSRHSEGNNLAKRTKLEKSDLKKKIAKELKIMSRTVTIALRILYFYVQSVCPSSKHSSCPFAIGFI